MLKAEKVCKEKRGSYVKQFIEYFRIISLCENFHLTVLSAKR